MANMAKEKIEGLAVIDTAEEQNLGKEVSIIEQKANSVVVNTDAELEFATELTKQVKTMQKQVNEYWEPIYKPAYATYKTVNDHKNGMLNPLKSAEKILKDKIGAYRLKVEREAKAREEALKRLMQEEKERKLAEAIKAEAEGDQMVSEFAMAEAEMMESMTQTVSVNQEAAKVKGSSFRKDYMIEIEDESKVPFEIDGVRLWKQIDMTAVKKLVSESGGKIQIPGIKYEEKIVTSVRIA